MFNSDPIKTVKAIQVHVLPLQIFNDKLRQHSFPNNSLWIVHPFPVNLKVLCGFYLPSLVSYDLQMKPLPVKRELAISRKTPIKWVISINFMIFIKWLKIKVSRRFTLQAGALGVEPVWQEIFRGRDDNFALQNEGNTGVINSTQLAFKSKCNIRASNFTDLYIHAILPDKSDISLLLLFLIILTVYCTQRHQTSCDIHYTETRYTKQLIC